MASSQLAGAPSFGRRALSKQEGGEEQLHLRDIIDHRRLLARAPAVRPPDLVISGGRSVEAEAVPWRAISGLRGCLLKDREDSRGLSKADPLRDSEVHAVAVLRDLNRRRGRGFHGE